MTNIELIPLQGILIRNTGQILLGQERKVVEKLLGKPSTIDISRAFYDSLEVRVDYDTSNKVEFIEFITGPFPEKITLSMYGINPFIIEAEELIEILRKHDTWDIDRTEAPYAYSFLNISVGVWRDAVPKDFDNTTITKETEEESNDAKFFWTIGIGIKDYYL